MRDLCPCCGNRFLNPAQVARGVLPEQAYWFEVNKKHYFCDRCAAELIAYVRFEWVLALVFVLYIGGYLLALWFHKNQFFVPAVVLLLGFSHAFQWFFRCYKPKN